MTPRCNICGSTEFRDYKGRPGEMCVACKSKARHRVGLAVYESLLFPLMDADPNARLLHMAPEPSLYPVLAKRFGAAYIVSDAEPERYPYAQCLRLKFPQDFDHFPDGFFTGIIHNHILEHLPGHYGDHFVEFARLLAPGGRMIFSFPGPYNDIDTKEGGEFLPSDADRAREFGVPEHIKIFGDDFYDIYTKVSGGFAMNDGVTDTLRAQLNVRPGMAPFHVWQRDGGTTDCSARTHYLPPVSNPVPTAPDPKANIVR